MKIEFKMHVTKALSHTRFSGLFLPSTVEYCAGHTRGSDGCATSELCLRLLPYSHMSFLDSFGVHLAATRDSTLAEQVRAQIAGTAHRSSLSREQPLGTPHSRRSRERWYCLKNYLGPGDARTVLLPCTATK